MTKGKTSKVVALSMDAESIANLNALAAHYKVKKSALVRMLVNQFAKAKLNEETEK